MLHTFLTSKAMIKTAFRNKFNIPTTVLSRFNCRVGTADIPVRIPTGQGCPRYRFTRQLNLEKTLQRKSLLLLCHVRSAPGFSLVLRREASFPSLPSLVGEGPLSGVGFLRRSRPIPLLGGARGGLLDVMPNPHRNPTPTPPRRGIPAPVPGE